MQVLASQLLFLANRNAGQTIPPLFWPVNCIKIGGHVARSHDIKCPNVNWTSTRSILNVKIHTHIVVLSYCSARVISPFPTWRSMTLFARREAKKTPAK